MRTFVALSLDADVREVAYAATAPLREAVGAAVAWTAPGALHLTLRFLDERSEEFVARLTARLAAALHRVPAIDLAIGGVGAFPSLARPRVVWLGVAPNSTLARLYQSVEDACAALDVPREERPFHPHVTLGRVRRGARLDGARLARVAVGVAFRAAQRVRSVDVMESVLGRGGARYRVVSAIPIEPGSENS